MKKRILLALMAVIMVFALCSCGDSPVAEITDNEGNIVEMTWEELYDLNSENEARYAELYDGAKIHLVDEVDSVSNGATIGYGTSVALTTIEINTKGGWSLLIEKDSHDDVITKLEKGTKIEIDSTLGSQAGELMHCTKVGDEPWVDRTEIKILD